MVAGSRSRTGFVGAFSPVPVYTINSCVFESLACRRTFTRAAYTRFSVVLVSDNLFAHVRPWHCRPVPAFAPTAAPLRSFLGSLGSLGRVV